MFRFLDNRQEETGSGLNGMSKIDRSYFAYVFKLYFVICRSQGPRKPGGTEMKWNTSATGLY
jgi:hypothetical protein